MSSFDSITYERFTAAVLPFAPGDLITMCFKKRRQALGKVIGIWSLSSDRNGSLGFSDMPQSMLTMIIDGPWKSKGMGDCVYHVINEKGQLDTLKIYFEVEVLVPKSETIDLRCRPIDLPRIGLDKINVKQRCQITYVMSLHQHCFDQVIF
jgi:hypothetical protein